MPSHPSEGKPVDTRAWLLFVFCYGGIVSKSAFIVKSFRRIASGVFVEIQTFSICNQLTKRSTERGDEFDASMIGWHRCIFPRDETFPAVVTMKFYMLLRRSDRGPSRQATLNFNFIDQDGKSTNSLKELRYPVQFREGERFHEVDGTISLKYSGVGDYRLDITAEGDFHNFRYQYDIEVELEN